MLWFGFAFSFIGSLTLCLAVEKYAPRLGLMDLPGHRKLQSRPVPRAGGLAIFFIFFLAQMFIGSFETFLLWSGALFVYAGGLYDDRRPHNSVFMKLIFQLTGVLLAGGQFYFYENLSGPLTLVCCGFVFLMINSFNLMDNMNGLTAGMSLLIAACLSLMGLVSPLETMPLAGALLGFLSRNFPSGKIFLGDQGSQFLGYWTSAVVLRALAHKMGPVIGVEEFLICVGFLGLMFLPFIFDTFLVIFIRIRNGVSIMKGDQNHFSHHLLRRGFTRTTAPLFIFVCHIVCLFTCYLWAKNWPDLV